MKHWTTKHLIFNHKTFANMLRLLMCFTIILSVVYFREDEEGISINCLKIMYEDELQLSLYRHWSLFESVCHSINLACKFKVWTLKGQKRLHEFLAEMG